MLHDDFATSDERVRKRRLDCLRGASPSPSWPFHFPSVHHTRPTTCCYGGYHHTQVEETLLADVPARARLGKTDSRKSILRELRKAHARNGDDRTKTEHFVRAAQRVVFDGNHTLYFVLYPSVRPPCGTIRSSNCVDIPSPCGHLTTVFR